MNSQTTTIDSEKILKKNEFDQVLKNLSIDTENETNASINDDLFNLNSLNKEDFYVKNDKKPITSSNDSKHCYQESSTKTCSISPPINKEKFSKKLNKKSKSRSSSRSPVKKRDRSYSTTSSSSISSQNSKNQSKFHHKNELSYSSKDYREPYSSRNYKYHNNYNNSKSKNHYNGRHGSSSSSSSYNYNYSASKTSYYDRSKKFKPYYNNYRDANSSYQRPRSNSRNRYRNFSQSYSGTHRFDKRDYQDFPNISEPYLYYQDDLMRQKSFEYFDPSKIKTPSISPTSDLEDAHHQNKQVLSEAENTKPVELEADFDKVEDKKLDLIIENQQDSILNLKEVNLKEKKSKKKKKEKNLRRSDRIKTIETKIKHQEELKIAEKIKKHQSIDNEDSNSMTFPLKRLNEDNINNIDPEIDDFSNSEELKILSNFYHHIDENSFVCKRKKLKLNKDARKMVCDCSTSERERALGILACGEDCLNRLLMIECGKKCPCEDFCTNKNFSNKKNAPIVPFKTELKGWGIKTLKELNSNIFLIEYVGEVIDLKEFKKRIEKYSQEKNEHFYFMSLKNDLFIDATKMGNISRFFNHSCDPNCETQKWTVNGELRIGFFTKRPVKPGEELTFDYQFQTVGKKQQKCHCGSTKCRGYLGVSSNNQSNLDHIWAQDSSDETSTSIESDESEVNVETNLKSTIKQKKYSSDSNLVAKSKRFDEKDSHKKDLDLNLEIRQIKTLSNKENVLKLCQLMVRTENLEDRLDILNLILDLSSDASLRLFMDYNGLKVLCRWMSDIDEKQHLDIGTNFKIKLLKVLIKLPIKNKMVLEELQLLTIVKRWSENNFNYNNLNEDNLEPTDKEIWIGSIIDNLVDFAVNKSDYSSNELSKIAQVLYDEWCNLKEAFKIPKKQRIEERKEHERELNLNESFELDNKKLTRIPSNSNNTNSNEYRGKRKSYLNSHNDESASYWGNKRYYNHCYNENGQYYSSQYHQPSNNDHNQVRNDLNKQKRREMFEKMVKEKEAAAAAASLNSIASSPTSTINSLNENTTRLSFNQDNCLIDSQKNHQLTDVISQTNISNSSNQNDPISLNITNINISDSHFKDLKQAIKYFMPISKSDSSNHSGKVLTRSPSSLRSISPCESLLSKAKYDDQDVKMSTMPLESVSNDLPSNWVAKKNHNGVTYYFNVKTKQSQWHLPQSLNTCSKNLPQKQQQPSSPTPTSSDENNKKFKEQFREKLSKLVIKLLQPYLRPECKKGHIERTEDFKYLARKFTHVIMEKEMSRTKSIQDLEMNGKVKSKAEEYIKKYMYRFEGSYSRKNDDLD